MNELKYTKNDGSVGINYKPQTGDKLISMSFDVFDSEPREVTFNQGTEKEETKTVINHGIYVKENMEKETVFLKLTDGQAKVLKQKEDLKDKTLEFYNYESANWGTQLGVKVLE